MTAPYPTKGEIDALIAEARKASDFADRHGGASLAAKMIRRLVAALSLLAGAGAGRLPIETAPKDGTRILVCSVSPATGAARWHLVWWSIPYEAAPSGWWEQSLWGAPSHPVVPEFCTHWMPLPPGADNDQG